MVDNKSKVKAKRKVKAKTTPKAKPKTKRKAAAKPKAKAKSKSAPKAKAESIVEKVPEKIEEKINPYIVKTQKILNHINENKFTYLKELGMGVGHILSSPITCLMRDYMISKKEKREYNFKIEGANSLKQGALNSVIIGTILVLGTRVVLPGSEEIYNYDNNFIVANEVSVEYKFNLNKSKGLEAKLDDLGFGRNSLDKGDILYILKSIPSSISAINYSLVHKYPKDHYTMNDVLSITKKDLKFENEMMSDEFELTCLYSREKFTHSIESEPREFISDDIYSFNLNVGENIVNNQLLKEFLKINCDSWLSAAQRVINVEHTFYQNNALKDLQY